jgi:hypothetical protein
LGGVKESEGFKASVGGNGLQTPAPDKEPG